LEKEVTRVGAIEYESYRQKFPLHGFSQKYAMSDRLAVHASVSGTYGLSQVNAGSQT
jgi:hypothetical protein